MIMLNVIEAAECLDRSVPTVHLCKVRDYDPIPCYKALYGYFKKDGKTIKVVGNFTGKNLVFIKSELNLWNKRNPRTKRRQ